MSIDLVQTYHCSDCKRDVLSEEATEVHHLLERILQIHARMNLEKLGGPWSCFGIFRVLSLRVLS